MRIAWCLVLAATVACARVADEAPRNPHAWETAAGSRLHPIFVTLPGGVRSFVAFEDRARGERCWPGGSIDGAGSRCLPTILQGAAFADDRCTVPSVALDESCDDTPKLVRLESGVFRGKQVARAFILGSKCEPIDLPAGARFVAATDERVTDADFVGFEQRTVDVGARLQVNMAIGADGSRYYGGLHDTAFDVDCAFEKASDGVVRCLPRPVTWSLDETCTHRVVSYRAGQPAPRVVALPRTVETRCEGLRAFRTTDIGVVERMRIDSSGRCVPAFSPSTSGPAVRIDDELPPTNFEPEIRVRVGDTRVTQWMRTIGTATLPSTLEDRDLDTACAFIFDKGAYRCFPRIDPPLSSPGQVIYSDAACTNPVICASRGCGEPRRFVMEKAGSCAWNVRAVGGAIGEPADKFTSAFDRCHSSAGLTCDGYNAVGAIMAPSSLASGTVLVE